MLFGISDILFLIVYYLIGYRKNVVRQNLANSFPERSNTELKIIERKYYRYLCDLMLETIKLLTISKEQIHRRFKPANVNTDSEVRAVIATGRNIIGAVGHYGNWELAAFGFSLFTDIERVIAYKPLANPTFDKLFKDMRERFGAQLVAMKDVLRKLVTLRGRQSFTMLVSDQTPVQESVQYFTNFLNQPTAVFLGVEKLAKSMDAIVIFCDIRRPKRGYYTYHAEVLVTQPKTLPEHEITNLHVAYLEKMIKEEPQYWLWSHRRWKFKPKNVNEQSA